MSQVGDIQYKYDDNGNIITSTQSGGIQNTRVYNAKDELVSYIPHSGSTTIYQYDAQGQRIEKKNPTTNTTTRYLNKDYEIQMNSGSTTTRKYIFFNNTKIATIEEKDEEKQIIYHHEDHL